MPPVTACIACRRLKCKCRWDGDRAASCIRCTRLGIPCETVPRRLGRKLGAKNRRQRQVDLSTSVVSMAGASPPSPISLQSDPLPEESHTVYDSPQADRIGDQNEPSGAWSRGGGCTSSTSASSFNMLSVLARVANDHPLQQHVTSATTDRTVPFDRAKFLDEFRQPARDLDPDPYRGLSLLEGGLGELFHSVESYHVQPGDEVVYTRIDQPRLDAAPEYDIIKAGLVSEDDASDLLEVYWSRVRGVILDPAIHTLPYMRSKSATLTSAVLMVAAQCLPVSEHTTSLVERLERHLEYLITQIDALCFQSVEISQALAIFVAWLSGHKLNRAWPLAAKAIAIAIELRLDVSPPPVWVVAPSPHHSATREQLTRNVERLWLVLNDWDRSSAFIRGRRPMIGDHPQTDDARVLTWCAHPNALSADAMTGACLVLVGVFVKLQLLTRAQHLEVPAFDFGDYLATLDSKLAAWQMTWFPLMSPQDQQRSLFDMIGFRFILLMTPYEYGLAHGWTEATMAASRDACLEAAIDLMTRALPIIRGSDSLLTVTSLYSYRLYRLAYVAFCTLRIITTSPGGSNADVFFLSVIAALARCLTDVRLHPNLTSITAVLGRRLMNASRRSAAARWRLGAGDNTVNTAPLASTSVGNDLYCTQSSGGHGGNDNMASGDPLVHFPSFSDGIFAMLDPCDIGLWGELGSVNDITTIPFVDSSLEAMMPVVP